MLWNRIFLGIIGLVVAISAGAELQLWLDTGTVWSKPRRGEPWLLSYDQTPFSYVLEVGGCVFLVLIGLLLVSVSVGGRVGRKSSSSN
jgi:hypothetical protein